MKNEKQASRFKVVFLFTFLLHSFNCSAQEMIFCEKTDPSGNAIHAGKEFTIDAKGSYLQILVKASHPLTGSTATIDLFLLDQQGEEQFENSRVVKVQTGWTWFSQQFTFFKQGKYVVYAYDESGALLATAQLNIKSNQ